MAEPSVQPDDSHIKDVGKAVLGYIDDAIPDDPHAATKAECIPSELSQDALDILWKLLDPKIVNVVGVKTHRSLPSKTLRRLTMKLTVLHNKLPHEFYLKDVRASETESRAAGGFADIYIGSWNGRPVALKRLRIDTRNGDKEKLHQQFCRESLLWRNLRHKHVIEFLGVSDDAFGLSICMVLPWMHRGNVRTRLGVLRRDGKLSGQTAIIAVNRWLHQISLGLAYLHSEDLVHGDLHGGNVLIDDDDNVLLTDFGMGVLADATAQNYASKHGGGAFQYRSPELLDPEELEVDNDRPTTASDVYAFACIAIELYAERVPFDGVTFIHVCRLVVDGKRPPRPHTTDGITMPDDMWKLTESCWAQQRDDRPTMQSVSEELAAITSIERPQTVDDVEKAVEGLEADPVPLAPTAEMDSVVPDVVIEAEPSSPPVVDGSNESATLAVTEKTVATEQIAPALPDHRSLADVFVELPDTIPTTQTTENSSVEPIPPPPFNKEESHSSDTGHKEVVEKPEIQQLIKVVPRPFQEPLEEHKGGCCSRCIVA